MVSQMVLVPREMTEESANAMECAFSTEDQWRNALDAAPNGGKVSREASIIASWALWDTLCPGIRQTDGDHALYVEAIRAAFTSIGLEVES